MSLNFISNVIYSLKRRYGATIQIVRHTSVSVDYGSGVKTVQNQNIIIKNAVVLDSTQLRQFSYDATYNQLGREFNYGSYFDTSNRYILLDAKDLPSSYTLRKDDYVIFQGKRWDILKFDKYDSRNAFILTMKRSDGASENNIINLWAESNVGLVARADQAIYLQVGNQITFADIAGTPYNLVLTSFVSFGVQTDDE